MEVVSEAVTGIAEQLAVLGKACDELSHRELIGLWSELTTVLRTVPTLEHRIINRLTDETEPCRLGEASWKKVLTTALRISDKEADRRLARAERLGPRRAMTGEPLAPVWESTAAAQARGLLDEEHVAVIADFHKELPSWVDVGTREAADRDLAAKGAGLGPAELRAVARRLAAMIDQDGPEPSDKDIASRVGVWFGPQRSDGTSSIHGRVSAEFRATHEAIWAKEAAPGHHPLDAAVPDPAPTPEEAAAADEASPEPGSGAQPEAGTEPGVGAEPDARDGGDDVSVDGDAAPKSDVSPESDEPPQAEAPPESGGPAEPDAWREPDRSPEPESDIAPEPHESDEPDLPEETAGPDLRSRAQRQHDAMLATARAMLASGGLGSHNGLPLTVIASASLQQLQQGAGLAVTGGGSLLPIPDLIRMAAAGAYHYLYVFDEHTGQSLYLGRTKRLANAAQRVVLHARDRGCTRPGCTAPGYWCQAHHAVADWKDDGQTNIDDLTFACGPDNRMVDKTGWTTRKNKKNQTEWVPPPDLDTGRHRVNGYHHPERHLLPQDELPEDGDDVP